MDYSLILLIIILFLSLFHLLIQGFRRPSDHSNKILHQVSTLKEQQMSATLDLRQEICSHRKELMEQIRDSRHDLDDRLIKFNQNQLGIFELLNRQVKDLVHTNELHFNRFHDETRQALEKMRQQIADRLETIRNDNNQQLEKMRATVDEKLHQTLEERLGRSFRIVSDHLEKVQKGLGGL